MSDLNMEKLAALFFFSALLGNSCEDDITANRAAVFSAEGQTVSLSCNYSVKAQNLQWYRQDPGSAPHYLLMITDTKEPEVLKAAAVNSRLTAELNQERNQVYLQIISAAVTDSAVYYCAVKPATGGQTKLLFGRGIKLTIEHNDKYAPSYFYLENQQSSACLAAGFSPHNATLTHQLFKKDPTKAEPVQISGDSLFNQVALVSEGQGDTCDPNRNKTSVCAGTLDKDPTVNSVTLIVLALRLLFFKTVVFNVLMTLRLWMSL